MRISGKAILLSGWLVWFVGLAWALPQGEPLKLPAGLSEMESRTILKERGAKSHVSAAVNVASQLLATAVKQTEASQFAEAVSSVRLYEALFEYADKYARALPVGELKERNKCLKEIEQAIFKQSRPLEAVRRELPYNYREQTDPLVETLKQLRLRAINDVLGGGTIIKE
jgi:hypothetical protein